VSRAIWNIYKSDRRCGEPNGKRATAGRPLRREVVKKKAPGVERLPGLCFG
jgi:hypothetical protein